MISTIPGVSLRTNGFLNSPAMGSQGTVGQHRYHTKIELGDWFTANLDTRYSPNVAVYSDSNVTVLMEGYLTDIEGQTYPQDGPSKAIANLYQQHGTGFLSKLRGSYTCLIADRSTGTAYLFNDRLASRPLFYREGDGWAFGPEVRALADIAPAIDQIDEQAVIEFLIFGSFYDDRSVFQGIRKLPQASLVTLRKNSFSIESYWNISFSPSDRPADESELIEECDALLRQAVRRTLRQVQRPVLLLSGGVDSRVILGTLLAEQQAVPAASYGTQEGDDSAVARKVAQASSLELIEFEIPMDDLTRFFRRAVLESDCRAETIDTPSLGPMHVDLAQRFDGFINGDECFGWKQLVSTKNDAFDAVGLFRLRQVNRLEDWLDSTNKRGFRDHIDDTRQALVEKINAPDPNNLKDALYYHSRVGNMLNAFAGGKLRLYEQARPLLDEDVIEFVTRLPFEMRADKRLLRRLLELKHPRLQQLGFSSKDSLPTADFYKKRLPQDQGMSDFFHQHLIKGLDPRLGALLDHNKFQNFVSSMLRNESVPATSTLWWASLPGMWRVAARVKENRVHPISLMMRVLQLQLYISK